MTGLDRLTLIAHRSYRNILDTSINRWLVGVFLVLNAVALVSAFQEYSRHQHDVAHYGEEVRDKWESSPDKHPHRMAHYGYVAFRSKPAISIFDRGLDSYLGNVVFLEAHRQNAVNFSNASQSSGLLRFGELSAGLVLQLLLPLLLFFWGFASVSDERARGTLKLYFTQGAGWREVVLGKALGIFRVSLLITLPAFAITAVLLLLAPASAPFSATAFSFASLLIGYLAYSLILSLLAVLVSATSGSSKAALMKLIGLWLLFVLIVPKTAQVVAQIVHPAPSKIAFDTAVEEEVIQYGDSHDPNDPYFTGMRDSLLRAYGVASVEELPFNYGGFQMKEGERISTEIYRKHQAELIDTYRKQNELVQSVAILNPYLALKQVSMTLAGTGFSAYQLFKEDAEAYRYNLAQTMNDLQIKYISNKTTTSADKGAVISQQFWRDFPPFEHRFLTRGEIVGAIGGAALSLAAWLFALALGVYFLAKKINVL